MTPLESTRQFCRHLSESNGVFPVPIGPAVPAQNAKESNHVLRASHTCHGGATVVTPKTHTHPSWLSYRPTMREPNPSIGLACSEAQLIFALGVCAIARGTCHVQPIESQPTPSSFRRSGASNEHSPVPIRPAVRAPEAKMLGHINIDRPTFSSDPPEEIFEQHFPTNANQITVGDAQRRCLHAHRDSVCSG